MGAIISMIIGVSVIAGLATVTTQKLHGALTGGAPKPARLQSLLENWRLELREARKALTKLKRSELDLLAQRVTEDAKLLPAKNRTSGYLRTIYKEDVAQFVQQRYPRAKVPQGMTLVQTSEHEYVYKLKGAETFLTIDGGPAGVIRGDVLTPANAKSPGAKLAVQRDGRTVHLDRGERTIATLFKQGAGFGIEPRAFEFVDVQQQDDRVLLEALTFYFLLRENLPV